ncbi:MAG TPA: hypothetical protein VGS79_09160 [Puia sp.]|nr:hypothetical protein [Puia sp.]
MKKLTFPLLILAFTFSACAQQSHLDKFYRQYHDTDDNLGLDPTFLLSASFGGHSGPDGSEDNSSNNDRNSGDSNDKDSNWMHKITAIRCMIIDGKKTPNAAREWSDLTGALRADHFEEWFSIRKGTGRVQLLSRDKGDRMEAVACLIVGDDGSGLFFHLRGHFTAADRARMESALQSHDSE